MYVFLGCVNFEALRPQTSEQGGHHVREAWTWNGDLRIGWNFGGDADVMMLENKKSKFILFMCL